MFPHSPDHGPATPGAPAPSARLAPFRTVLANGTVVTAKETRKTPAVTMNLAIRAGSLCDPPDGAGATFLLSKLLDRGTARRSAGDIADALETRGASLSFSVNRHVLSVLCTCLSADFDAVLDIIGDVLIQPAAWIGVHGLTLAVMMLASLPLLGWRWRSAGLAVMAAGIAGGMIR